MQRFTGCFFASPCTWAWERNTMLWLCKEVCGWSGEDVGGITTPGGSTSLQSAVFVARRARLPDDSAIIRGTVYCSDQVHYALRKACMLVGVPRANLRVLPTSAEHGYRLPLDLLREQVGCACSFHPPKREGGGGGSRGKVERRWMCSSSVFSAHLWLCCGCAVLN